MPRSEALLSISKRPLLTYRFSAFQFRRTYPIALPSFDFGNASCSIASSYLNGIERYGPMAFT